MKRNRRILWMAFVIWFIVGSCCLPAWAWEMEGNINPVTGSFNHDFIAEQAVKILLNDWYGATENDMIRMGLDTGFMDPSLKEYFSAIMDYKSDFEQGACDPDKDTLNNYEFVFSSHFYDPDTKQTWYTASKDHTARTQTERFVRMAVAQYKEAEESRARALALIETAEKNLENTELSESDKNAFREYKKAVLKTDIQTAEEGLRDIKNRLTDKKKNMTVYMNGIESAKQLEQYQYAKDQLVKADTDWKYEKDQRKVLAEDYAKKEKRLDLEKNSNAVNGPYKEAERQLRLAKEALDRNDKSIAALEELIAECTKKLSAYSTEKINTMNVEVNQFNALLEVEKKAANYEKAVAWYKMVRLEGTTPGSNMRQRIDGDNRALREKSIENKAKEALKAVNDAENSIKTLNLSSISIDPAYNDLAIDYIGRVEAYKNAVVKYNVGDIDSSRQNIEKIKAGVPDQQRKAIAAYESAFDAYYEAGKKFAKAAYCFGYASHFFADTCNPHHAANNIVPEPPYNHRTFELYAQENQERFKVNSLEEVVQNHYGIGKRFLDQSDCYKMENYSDMMSYSGVYDFIGKELSIMGKVAKDSYYICGFEQNPNPYKLLKDGNSTNGVGNDKELQDIQAKWDETAEKTLAVSQSASAKLFLEFLLELKDSEKFSVVTRTADGLSSGSEDNLYLCLKSGNREEKVFLDRKNDNIEESLQMDRGDGMKAGGMDIYPVYINKRLWCQDGKTGSVPELDECKLKMVKGGAMADAWECEDAQVIYKDSILIAQSGGKKTLKAGSDDELPLKINQPPENDMQKVSLRLKNSKDSPADLNHNSRLTFGLVNQKGDSEEFLLNDFMNEKLKPGQVDEYDFYIPGKADAKGIKSCWIQSENPLESFWKCDFVEVYVGDLPVSTQYYENGREVRNEKLYHVNNKSLTVKVKTSDEWFAGTDDSISFYIINGENKKISFPMDKKYFNDFEKGCTDTYCFVLEDTMGIRDITDIQKIGIEKESGSISDDWKCEYLEAWLSDRFLTYKRFNQPFDTKNSSQEWDVTQKLYVAITGDNGEKLQQEGLSMNIKTVEGVIKTLSNPKLVGEQNRKAHEFNVMDETGLPVDLRTITEVWLGNQTGSGTGTQEGKNVEIFADADLETLVSFHTYTGNDVEEHWYVNGLRPAETVKVTLKFQTEEEYPNNVAEISHCPTYFIIETDIKKGDKPVQLESRCIPRIESKSTEGNNKKYIKTYTAEFEIKNPEFLVSNIHQVRIEKRKNNNVMEPGNWDCTMVEMKIQQRTTELKKSETYKKEGISGIRYMLESPVYTGG